jgi:hypothetical protein
MIKLISFIIITFISLLNTADFLLRITDVSIGFKYDLTVILFVTGVFVCFPYNLYYNQNLLISLNDSYLELHNVLHGIIFLLLSIALTIYSYDLILWDDKISSLHINTGYYYMFLTVFIYISSLSSFYSLKRHV